MGEAAVVIEGATDAEVFEAYYVEEFLAPTTLEAGQVVVLDGLGAHRTQKVRELVEATGVRSCLPTLAGPEPHRGGVLQDEGPRRAKAGARTCEALVEAIAAALSAVTLEDAAGWFVHAGYEPRDQHL